MEEYTQLDLFTDQEIPSILKPIPENQIQNYSRYNLTGFKDILRLIGNSRNNVWNTFHNLAAFIYQNGDWTWFQYQQAAEFLFPFLGFKIDKNSGEVLSNPSQLVKTAKFLPYSEVKDTYFHASKNSKYSYTFKYVLNKADKVSHYLILTSDFKQLWHSTTLYYLKNGKRCDFTYISKSVLIGGYQIITDLLDEIRKCKKFNIDTVTLFEFLKGLISGPRSNNHLLYQRYMDDSSIAVNDVQIIERINELFKDKKENKPLKVNNPYDTREFVIDYLFDAIDEILMLHYQNRTSAKVTSIKSSVTSHIQFGLLGRVMDSHLNGYFRRVLLNDSVNVELFDRFEKSALELLEILPKGVKKPRLVFKHVSNAAGTFDPVSNEMVLDLNPKNVGVKKVDGSSIFLHEYGHYIDYIFSNEKSTLSMSEDFKPILSGVQSYAQKTTLLKDNARLMAVIPTEVFARSLELYLFGLGVKNHAMGTLHDYVDPKYTIIRNSSLNLVKEYFDKHFPEIKKNILKK